MKKVLITGSGGLIGSEAVEYYCNKGYDVVGIDNNYREYFFGASKLAADIMVQEYGKYFNLKTVVFRGGCLTGQKHSGVELHGFLSYLVKCCLNDILYTIFGYKGKQVRDNIHSSDLISAFDCYFETPRINGEVYNIGGGIYSNCSVLEAIVLIQDMTKKKLNYTIKDENRIGDHKWWVSDTRKFIRHFPNWKQEYNMEKIIETFIA